MRQMGLAMDVVRLMDSTRDLFGPPDSGERP